MLEGLDSIEWSKLSHAYGKAKDVPGFIRTLGGAKASAADHALSELFGNIWHQGTVYEATPHAVPFLVELVKNPKTHQRPQIMQLLQCIAEGHGRHATLTHQAVDRHMEELVALRHDPSVEVRRQLPATLLPIIRGKEWILSHALQHLDEEPDGYCAANWIFAISRCCIGDPTWAGKLQTPAVTAPPIIHLALAHVTLASGEEKSADNAAREILQALLTPDAYADYFPEACFLDKNSNCDMEGLFMALLRLLPPKTLARLITPVCEVAPQLGDFSAEMICEPLLQLAFANGVPHSANELSEEQKILLQQVARPTNIGHADETRSIFEQLQRAGVLSEIGIKSRTHW